MPAFDPSKYADVQLRINRFYDMYPEGSIVTFLASDTADWKLCRYRAEVRKVAAHTYADATGYAFEAAGGSGANRTSHEENCETSAIGRALANMGKDFAKDATERPSAQEMSKVAWGPATEEVAFDHDSYRPAAKTPPPPPQQLRPSGPMDPSAPATEKQIQFVIDLCVQLGLGEGGVPDAAAISAFMQMEFEYDSWPNITKGMANEAIDKLKAMRSSGEKLR